MMNGYFMPCGEDGAKMMGMFSLKSRAMRAINALKQPDPSFGRVPNIVRQSTADVIQQLLENNEVLSVALKRSVQLQSHYANLLNQRDGGRRLLFQSSEDWIDRLKSIDEISATNEPVSNG